MQGYIASKKGYTVRMFQKYGPQIVGSAYQEFVSSAVFVDVTSASNWWFTERDKSPMLIDDIPIWSIPWPIAWIEYHCPSQVRFGGEVGQWPSSWYIGSIIQQWKVEEGDAEDTLREDDGLKTLIANGFIGKPNDAFWEQRASRIRQYTADTRLKWIVANSMYFAPGKSPDLVLRQVRYVDEFGCAMKDLSITMPIGDYVPESLSLMNPIFFAVSLMHCKNVKLEPIIVPPKVAAKRQKRGIPSVQFKTLVVEPMRQQVRREAAEDPTSEQNHIKRALHIARGHFKDYRDGGGLFGKLHGLYWWDMHVRGDAQMGAVVKDYQVRH